MHIIIPKEMTPGENRVAATPDTISKMLAAGFTVSVESQAGEKSHLTDQAYIVSGAQIETDVKNLYAKADIILKVQPPIFNEKLGVHEIDLMRDHTILFAPITAQQTDLIEKLTAKSITTFSLLLLPRIARAQSMDILSSMSNIAGYKSVILAADYLTKFFPMLTTAAGTILPAKAIVIGVGVAGLQAIATARRLGAVVIAFDTRPATEEQVKSLGAKFVSLASTHHETQDVGGYAKAQSADFYQQEQTIITNYLQEADIVITTALIPGKSAPLLITAEMIDLMKPGSVIVDLAAEQGGNCAFTEKGKIVVKNHITFIGLTNLPSLLAAHASQLFAKNIWSFLNYMVKQIPNKEFDLTDEIIKNCLLTRAPEVVLPQ